VDDQRAGRRTTFHRVDAGYGFSIQRVCAQTIYGFGGERDQTSSAEEAGGVFDLSAVD
jgi:hypothetical protein